MDYKDLFKLIENFTADDMKLVREKIEKIIENNPKVSLQDAIDQIESFKNIKK
jgi:hypothetical protein